MMKSAKIFLMLLMLSLMGAGWPVVLGQNSVSFDTNGVNGKLSRPRNWGFGSAALSGTNWNVNFTERLWSGTMGGAVSLGVTSWPTDGTMVKGIVVRLEGGHALTVTNTDVIFPVGAPGTVPAGMQEVEFIWDLGGNKYCIPRWREVEGDGLIAQTLNGLRKVNLSPDFALTSGTNLALVDPRWRYYATNVNSLLLSNSLSEASVFRFPIPANKLGTNKFVKYTAILEVHNFSASNLGVLNRLRIGSTDFFSDNYQNITSGNGVKEVVINGVIAASGAANAQVASVRVAHSATDGASPGYADLGIASSFAMIGGDATENSATDLVVEHFWTFNVQHTTTWCRLKAAWAED